MNKLKHKLLTINKINYGYWTNDISNYKSIYILLSPGAYSGDFFNYYVDYLPKGNLYIIPDYPSRGLSADIKDNGVDSVANFVCDLIKELKIEKVNIIALSYGTQVVIQMIVRSCFKINKIILVAPGEYYLGIFRKLLKFIFAPLLVIPSIHKFIRNIILKLGFMDYLPDTKLDFILKQWMGTLSYSYPKDFISDVETIVVNYSEDSYVSKSSLVKLNNIFTNSKTTLLKGKHPTKISSFGSFFTDVLDKYE